MLTLSARLNALLVQIVGTALVLGTAGDIHVTVHYDTRAGFLHLSAHPLSANPDTQRNRITTLVTEDWQTYHKLKALDTYLRRLIRYGYSPFPGFSPRASPDSLPVTSPAVAGHAQPGYQRLLTRAQSGEANPFQKVRPG